MSQFLFLRWNGEGHSLDSLGHGLGIATHCIAEKAVLRVNNLQLPSLLLLVDTLSLVSISSELLY